MASLNWFSYQRFAAQPSKEDRAILLKLFRDHYYTVNGFNNFALALRIPEQTSYALSQEKAVQSVICGAKFGICLFGFYVKLKYIVHN